MSAAHLSWQVAPSAQLIEQPPTHETLQVEPALHEMLPLAPNVIAQLACSPQSTLHESPQAPSQVDCALQASVQLAPQVCVVTLQVPLAGQAQVVPVHAGGLVDTPPQPSAQIANNVSEARKRAIQIGAMLCFIMEGEVPPGPRDQAPFAPRPLTRSRPT